MSLGSTLKIEWSLNMSMSSHQISLLSLRTREHVQLAAVFAPVADQKDGDASISKHAESIKAC